MLPIYGEFNNISKKLSESVKPLGPNERAVYRLLDGDIDPNTKQVFHGSGKTLRGRDTIWDPYANDGNGKFVDIGLVKTTDQNQKVLKCEKMHLGFQENQLLGPNFTLYGNNDLHRKWHFFFSLCNYNAGNPRRDVSVHPVIEQIDYDKEAKQKGQKRSYLKDALNTADLLEHGDIVMFAGGMNWDTSTTPRLLREKVEDYAQNNPEEFLKAVNSPEIKHKSIIKEALKRGLIRYDGVKHQMVWGSSGQVIAILDRVDGENELTMFHQWGMIAKNGFEIMEKIKKMVNESIVKEKPGTAASNKKEKESAGTPTGAPQKEGVIA